MAKTDHKETFTYAMAEAGHKYIKDLVLKAFFKLYFHFHVVWIFKKFQFDFRFDFKLSG